MMLLVLLISTLMHLHHLAQASDPDIDQNVSQLIVSRGFGVEEYNVETSDGYIIGIQRVINPMVAENYRNNLKPMLLVHGLFSDSSEWTINSPQVKPRPFPATETGSRRGYILEEGKENLDHPNSLAYYLANSGFDVFLANVRGNLYGRQHIHLTTADPEFWDFSYDEFSNFDIPAAIKKVQNVTGKTKMGYIGHSQGSTIMFALMSSKPEYADIIEPFIALAPVAFLKNFASPVGLLVKIISLVTYIDAPFLITPFNKLLPGFCESWFTKKLICDLLYYFIFSFDGDNLDDNRWSAYLSSIPSGTSLKNIDHYGQGIYNDRFARFDFGPLVNKVKYGQTSPPDYDLSKIRSESIILFTAQNDVFATPADVDLLVKSLTVKPYARIDVTHDSLLWNHFDFGIGRHAGKVVNTKIIEILGQFNDY